MTDYKMEAAKAAVTFIKPEQTIGLGAGTTMANLLSLLAADDGLSSTLTFVSSSFKTTELIRAYGFKLQSKAYTDRIDIYFDGCDQMDAELNALKSGGGIHTSEKILAARATEFILAGDSGKLVDSLDATYPLVVEVLPDALLLLKQRLQNIFPAASINVRMAGKKDGAVITENGNLLMDVYFNELMPPGELNVLVKMIPGVVEHSLFYRMASKAIIAGPEGIRIMRPAY